MAIKFSPGPCGCCNPECCIGGSISSATVQVAGVVNGSCTNCSIINGTYFLQILPGGSSCTFSIRLPPPFIGDCPLTSIDLLIAANSVSATLGIGFTSPRFSKSLPDGVFCADLPGMVLPFLLGQQLCNLMGATVTILSINP